ncbi:MAG: hypothetical protein Kow0067_19050 [Coriobacteriia bacterium]|nr:hypothetical protein [Anaerosomatales bacterium]
MRSLYEELSEKLSHDPRLLKRGGPRVDLSLLLFNARDEIRELWDAADRSAAGDEGALHDLREAVEALRPIFGERTGS